MLHWIKIKDFQNHESKRIDFSPTVTTIVGESDEGKSAIIRALGAVCLNQPSTEDLVRDGAPAYDVLLCTDKGKVRRYRGTNGNVYALRGKVYKSFGRNTVPEDIQNVLNISDINFQWQLDPPFWITDSPAQLARNLNEIVNLKIMDLVLGQVQWYKTQANSELKVRKDDLAHAKKTVKELKFVREFDEELKRLERLDERLTESRVSSSLLSSLVEDAVRLRKESDRWNSVVLCGSPLLTTATELHALSASIKDLSAGVKQTHALSKLIGMEAPDLTELEQAREVGDAHAESRRELESLVEELEQAQVYLSDEEVFLEEVLAEFGSKTKGVCPTCGRKI